MIKEKEYAFVLDCKDKHLSPTPVNNAWFLIRRKRAQLINKYPMVIQLNKEIFDKDMDKSTFICGIDDGSIHVGLAIVQKCKTKNKVIFKGTIEQRKDVSGLMETRKGYRHYHRSHKRYRQARFDNRASSKCKGRIAPSIKQKKDSILRVIVRLNKYINIHKFILEDVQIDIRRLQDGKLYKWQYQKSNRLDENLRKATIMRDGVKCMECGKTNCILEAHHIVPRRLKGSNTITNLITLCSNCHDKTEGVEEKFISKYQTMINGKNIRFDYAQHVMQGKNYLREQLSNIAYLELTIGCDTANKRIDWNIDKSHSNDAIVITGLKINKDNCNIKDWIIKPIRRQSKVEKKSPHHIKHGDLVSYYSKTSGLIKGYVSAIRKSNGAIKITTIQGNTYGTYSYKKVKQLWKFNKIYFMEKEVTVI